MGKVFEKMAKEYLIMNSGIDGFPVLTDISEYQISVIDENKKPRQIEIDLMGRNNNNILLIGECKFKNSPFDKTELETLLAMPTFRCQHFCVLASFWHHFLQKKIVNPGREVEYLFVWLKGKPLPLADEAFIDFVKQSVSSTWASSGTSTSL